MILTLFFPIEWVPVPVPMGRKKKRCLYFPGPMRKPLLLPCNPGRQFRSVPTVSEHDGAVLFELEVAKHGLSGNTK